MFSIGAAYEVLSDPQRRREWEMEQRFNNGGGQFWGQHQSFHDPFAMFEELTRQMFNSPFHSMMGGGSRRRDPFDDFFPNIGSSMSSNRDPFFDDPFFMGGGASSSRMDPMMMGGGPSLLGGFGGFGGFGNSFSNMSSSSSFGSSTGRSVSTSIVNGRKETRETIRNADGTTHIKITTPEGVQEHFVDQSGRQLPSTNGSTNKPNSLPYYEGSSSKYWH